MGSKIVLILIFTLLSKSIGAAPGLAEAQAVVGAKPKPDHAGAITLQEALSRVFEWSPELEVSELEIEAASARIIQAGLRPNPEIMVEGENLPTISRSELLDNIESTLQMSQRFELGGKRHLRVRAAEANKSVANRKAEVRKAGLIAETSLAFIDVLADQQRLSNRQELTRLARQSHSVVADRVEAGKASPVEQTRAEVALATVRLEEQKQLQKLLAAKDRLAAIWGGSHQDFDRVEGIFDIPPEPASLALSCSDLALADASIQFRQETLESERASAKPDITLSAGFKNSQIENLNAWIFSVSLPLPLFDKREGAIAEAQILLNKAASEKKIVEWRLRKALIQARRERETSLLEANSLDQEALPSARNALSAIEEGYRLGKFEYMNVLDAQRTYAELQRRYIEAVASGLKAGVEINRLTYCDSQNDLPVQDLNRREANYEK